MSYSLLRLIAFAILAFALAHISDVHAKCFVAKGKFIAVDLTDENSTSKGPLLIEYIHVHPNGTIPPSTFRIKSDTGAWLIPSVCMTAMKERLTEHEIDLVISTIRKK